MGTVASPHFVIFPFMSHGHTIPLLHLATLLRNCFVAVTIFTTPANAPSIHDFLRDPSISVIELPFPEDVHDIPPDVENTEKLPSMSYFYQFARATKLMQPFFEQALSALQHPPTCVISDAFLGWTQESAHKFGIPRYFFFGMSVFATTLYQLLGIERPHAETISPDESFTFSSFPWLKFTRNDFEPPFGDLEPKGLAVDFMLEQGISFAKSRGMITNSFYELEPRFADYFNQHLGPKSWCVGPLCLAKRTMKEPISQTWMQWLNDKLAEKQPVLYVAFGTQADISPEQIQEIAKGLELSNTCFLWVTRQKVLKHLQGFFEMVDASVEVDHFSLRFMKSLLYRSRLSASLFTLLTDVTAARILPREAYADLINELVHQVNIRNVHTDRSTSGDFGASSSDEMQEVAVSVG